MLQTWQQLEELFSSSLFDERQKQKLIKENKLRKFIYSLFFLQLTRQEHVDDDKNMKIKMSLYFLNDFIK